MNRKSVMVTTLALLSALAFGPNPAGAQAASLKQQLVGTWTYVIAYNILSNGTRIEPQGQNGKGTLMFDASGRFVWSLIKPDLPKFASNNRQTGTDAENRAVVQGSLSYFGTYEADEAGNALVMHIEASSFPNFTGAQQRRSIKLVNDELTVINAAGASGGTAYVSWKRAK